MIEQSEKFNVAFDSHKQGDLERAKDLYLAILQEESHILRILVVEISQSPPPLSIWQRQRTEKQRGCFRHSLSIS